MDFRDSLLFWGRILKTSLTQMCLLTKSAFPNGSLKAPFDEGGIVYTKIFKSAFDLPLHKKAAFLPKALLNSPTNHIVRITGRLENKNQSRYSNPHSSTAVTGQSVAMSRGERMCCSNYGWAAQEKRH